MSTIVLLSFDWITKPIECFYFFFDLNLLYISLQETIQSKNRKEMQNYPLPRALEGSRKLRFPDFMTVAQDGGKVVSLMHQPPLPPRNAPRTHFC